MLEYVLAFTALLVISAVMVYVVRAGFRQSERCSTLVRSDCP